MLSRRRRRLLLRCWRPWLRRYRLRDRCHCRWLGRSGLALPLRLERPSESAELSRSGRPTPGASSARALRRCGEPWPLLRWPCGGGRGLLRLPSEECRARGDERALHLPCQFAASARSSIDRRSCPWRRCRACRASCTTAATVAFLYMFSMIFRQPTPVLYAQKEISPCCVA